MNKLTSLFPSSCATNLINITNVKNQITIKQLFSANLHLGHSPESWNPNMMSFIYGTRNNIHIINLDHTLTFLKRAIDVTRDISANNGIILFLGSKPILHSIVLDAAINGNAYFATQWKGGLITNKERVLRTSVGFDPDKVVQENKNISDSLINSISDSLDGSMEASQVTKQQPFVHSPDLIIILDYPNNLWAIREANFAGVPVIAICDTDCDPSLVQYPIPANDDSVIGLQLIAGILSRASKEGSLKGQEIRKRDTIKHSQENSNKNRKK